LKTIEFIPAFDFVDYIDINAPIPATRSIPEWYKNLNLYTDQNYKLFINPNRQNNLTAKACVPLIDSMSIGYIITMPCDVEVVDPNVYGYKFVWGVDWDVIGEHSEKQVNKIGIYEEFEKRPYKFNGIWRVKAPKEYSILYTHPFYNFHLPFLTTTGIVDSDLYDTQINIPFFMKKNFIGTIKKDTPIAQIIPIKRETWKSEIKKYQISHKYFLNNIKLKNFRSYKHRFWNSKKYK
jgi:hypothetical protein